MNLSRHIITFVGAGPGVADLITLRGLKALQSAEVVLYDALIDTTLLDYCAAETIRVDVGKRCASGRSRPQSETNALLVEYGLQFERVVRLKGGDPSVFGRLDEELNAVRAVGLSVEVIPGVTAALAAAAAAQIPLTRRGVARGVRFITASIGANLSDNTWNTCLDPMETLVFYMAGKHLHKIGVHLLMNGFTADTPVVIMRGVSWNNQESQRLLLQDLPALMLSESDAPCLLMIGQALA